MKTITEEKCFPRTVRNAPSSFDEDGSEEDYEITKKRLKKSKKQPHSNGVNDILNFQQEEKAQILSKKILRNGMLVLGCIEEVLDYVLILSLPGKLLGRVPIAHISDHYTNALQDLSENQGAETLCHDLQQMFQVGQYVVAKVTEIPEEGIMVTLSMKPGDIHGNFFHSTVKKGMVLTGAVKSNEEHGYVVDFGINSLRAFLKHTEARSYIEAFNNSKPLGIGQLVRCFVKKVKPAETTTNIDVTIDLEKVSKAVVKEKMDLTVDTLLPGMVVEATVKKAVKDGLQVSFLNYKAYCHTNHLPKLWKDLSYYEIDSVFPACVLYVLPLVKCIHVTMHPEACGLEEGSEALHPGTIVENAKVMSVDDTVVLKLDKNAKGIVKLGHLEMKHDKHSDVREELKRKYVVGSKYQCRILKYSFMDKIYICTLRKEDLRERILHYSDIKVGMKVDCIVLEMEKNGIAVRVGKVVGFIPSHHVDHDPDMNWSEKYQPGEKVRGQVLVIEKRRLILTLKPMLMKSGIQLLTNYEHARIGMLCKGTVTKVANSIVLVAFCGNVKGRINLKKKLHKGYRLSASNFYVGQTLKCSVLSCNPEEEKLLLTLDPESQEDLHASEAGIKTGKEYDVQVLKVDAIGLIVQVCGQNDTGVIPYSFLTDHPSLNECVANVYQQGQKLCGVICVTIQHKPLFTSRQFLIQFLKTNYDLNGKFTSGQIVPCIVQKLGEEITLRILHNNSVQKILPKKIILDDLKVSTLEDSNLQRNDVLMVKLKSVQNDKIAAISVKVSHCWDGKLQSCVDLLESYLLTVDKITKSWQERGEKLTKYSAGEYVKGTVVEISRDVVLLDVEGVQAIAHSSLIQGVNLERGDVIPAKVLFVNLPMNCLEVCVQLHTTNKVKKTEGNNKLPQPGTVVKAEIILIKKDFVLGVLKNGSCKGQLVHLLSRQHINDYVGNFEGYSLGDTFKIHIEKVVNNKIIGVQRKTCLEMEKANKMPGKRNHSDASISREAGRFIKLNNSNRFEDEENADVKPSKRKKSKSESRTEESSADSQIYEQQDAPSSGGNSECGTFVKAEASEVEECNGSSACHKIKSSKKKKSTNMEDLENVKRRKTSNADEVDSSQNKLRSMSEFNSETVNGVCEESRVKEDSKMIREPQCERPNKGKANQRKSVDQNGLPRLNLSTGFVWDIDESADASQIKQDPDSSSVENEDDEKEKKSKKLSFAEKKELARQEEEKLRKLEESHLDPDHMPESAADFDRLVLSSPDSSIIWVKYMAFHLQATEIDKARNVAQRALKTISFREEQEKFNVWIALLNLENMYGTEESLGKVFEEAVQMNDSFKVYSKMLEIYAESHKEEEGEKILNKMLKKFKMNKDVFTKGGQFYMTIGRVENARHLLQKALKVLNIKEHVNVIVKFAQLENQWGSKERAQTLLEHVLTNFPKRTDVWISYVDMLVKGGDIEGARQLLERASVQKLPSKKMKSIFKKYVQFEEAHGIPANVEKVKQMVMNYVESVTSTTQDI